MTVRIPPSNQSRSRARRDDLAVPLAKALEAYLAPDSALHDAVRKAGGALISAPGRAFPTLDG